MIYNRLITEYQFLPGILKHCKQCGAPFVPEHYITGFHKSTVVVKNWVTGYCDVCYSCSRTRTRSGFIAWHQKKEIYEQWKKRFNAKKWEKDLTPLLCREANDAGLEEHLVARVHIPEMGTLRKQKFITQMYSVRGYEKRISIHIDCEKYDSYMMSIWFKDNLAHDICEYDLERIIEKRPLFEQVVDKLNGMLEYVINGLEQQVVNDCVDFEFHFDIEKDWDSKQQRSHIVKYKSGRFEYERGCWFVADAMLAVVELNNLLNKMRDDAVNLEVTDDEPHDA